MGAAAAMIYCNSGCVQGQCHQAMETACPQLKDFIDCWKWFSWPASRVLPVSVHFNSVSSCIFLYREVASPHHLFLIPKNIKSFGPELTFHLLQFPEMWPWTTYSLELNFLSSGTSHYDHLLPWVQWASLWQLLRTLYHVNYLFLLH